MTASNHLVIFYPKFHHELNFIEKYWCAAKFYAREHCKYSFDALWETVPIGLNSVSTTSIHWYYLHCMRISNTSMNQLAYGIDEFRKRVYKGHCQIVEKYKWYLLLLFWLV